ncbi:uncharacterized protein LOC101850969 [Aplysia californica]|uniref:Uncharacterized protein LOC101850969 n=1 Tax=Aplysia californica TaxID=6500 RepID=A0ABM0JVF4_APLCA|nr:uncharacterized protein LOC101850969 [Aplysia californica]XP_035826713.1 uncharacterized protein LOC101850969 [Aplysia californica]
MPRLFVVFRTYDRIWTCRTFTRELASFELDMSSGAVKLMFTVDPIRVQGSEDRQYELYPLDPCSVGAKQTEAISTMYCLPHRNFSPKVLRLSQKQVCCVAPPPPPSAAGKGLMRRFSLPAPPPLTPTGPAPEKQQDVMYYVLPNYKCTFLCDAHVASCVSSELARSRTFRRRFLRFVRSKGGFRNCIPDYEQWTEEEREMWDNYLCVPYMIDVVAVWPQQKIDFPWCDRILCLLNKHITLEEGFAWLSTLGGAHSALGEVFSQHAEQAGKISKKQLKVAMLLGNEQMIARCFVFWSWSLMQRGELRRCRRCIRNVWRYCKRLRCRDHILENMCKAVWSRLQYKQSLAQAKTRAVRGEGGDRHGNSSGEDGDDSDDAGRSNGLRLVARGAAASRVAMIFGSKLESCASETACSSENRNFNPNNSSLLDDIASGTMVVPVY